MREIKFRLRDKDNKIIGYEYWDSKEDHSGHWIYDFSMNGVKEWFQNFKWLTKVRYKDQFTGLHDKNGREIYEGDIVKKTFYLDEKTQLNIPSVGIGQVTIGTRGIRLSHDLDNFMEETGFTLEIIGNIYENPELLNG